MAIEARRGCGYRKVGGLYLVCGSGGMGCDRLPFPLCVCPTCNQGIKQSRGWTWIDLFNLVSGFHDPAACRDRVPSRCPMCSPPRLSITGLLWIGEKFYKTVDDFIAEGDKQGISRRIKAVPRGFKLGETWVLLAHSKAVYAECPDCAGANGPTGKFDWDCATCGGTRQVRSTPGIFRVFKPERIEKLITQSDATPETLKELSDAGITPVIVPDDDKDHKGSVYDKEDDDA